MEKQLPRLARAKALTTVTQQSPLATGWLPHGTVDPTIGLLPS